MIDIHTHVVPRSFPGYLGRHMNVPWPSMVQAQPCHKHVMVSGNIFRTVSHQCWDCDVRRIDMAQRQVDIEVLSPMPELLSYWLAPEDGAALCRYLNEVIAEMVAHSPKNFVGLAAIPLQDVDMAIHALDHAIHVLGLSGVEIGSNVNGFAIGHSRFFPFFEAAANWGAAVFVHPLRPSGLDRLIGHAALEQVLAFPGDTGLAAASMITGGTFSKLPNLRIAYSHGGGTLQALLPRLQFAWNAMPNIRSSLPGDPLDAARRMFYDDLVYDADTIRRLIQVFGSSQIMVGTDYPFAIMDLDPDQRLRSLDLPNVVLDQLRSGNARRWLNLN
jgi:aminocarboxymuconate-semialdehyde decarboxylase